MNSNTDNSDRVVGLAYPLFSLPGCMKIAEAVRDLGGAKADVQRSVLASHVGAQEKASAFLQRIGSAKYYGLIDGRGTYRLTKEAIRYFYPANDGEKRLAALSFLSSPAIFSALIGRYEGDRLQDQSTLGNILHRELNVPNSWKDRVAGFFIRSAEFCGVVDSQGILRVNAARHGMLQPSGVSHQHTPEKTPAENISAALVQLVAPTSADYNVLDFGYGVETIHLKTPRKISKTLWEKLNGYVQLLKPEN